MSRGLGWVVAHEKFEGCKTEHRLKSDRIFTYASPPRVVHHHRFAKGYIVRLDLDGAQKKIDSDIRSLARQ